MRSVLSCLVLLWTAPVLAGPIEVRAGLVLGDDATAEIRFHAPAVRLVTSAGAIATPVVGASERSAIWTLPVEHRPQVALIAAVDAGGSVVAWIAVPLAGRAKIKVETAPRASVIVHVDGATFGPVVANGTGVAQVPIVVPPDITEATAVSTSVSGNATEKRLVLGTRPSPRVLALCAGERVIVVAATLDGTASAVAPTISVSAGALGATRRAAPGVFEATIGDAPTLSPLASATFGGSTATCELAVPPEAPLRLELRADRARFDAGSDLPVQLRATLTYAGHRPPLDVSVIGLDADAGAISAAARDGAVFTATWSLPDAFAGRSRALVHARAAGLEASLAIELGSAAPARIDLATPAPLRADGETRGRLVARVVDRFGNLTAAAKLVAHGRGRIGAFTRGPAGELTAPYTAPRSYEAGDDLVELAGGGVTGHVVVPLVPIPHRFAITGELGYLSNFGRVSAPTGALAGDVRLLDHLALGVELGIYRAAFDAMAPDETIATRVIAVPILARLAYQLPLARFQLFAGAGLGVALVSTRLTSPSVDTLSAGSATFAASVFAGVSTRAGAGRIVLEAQYLHATLGGDVSGRIGGLAIAGGYGFEL